MTGVELNFPEVLEGPRKVWWSSWIEELDEVVVYGGFLG